jgi:hypothetical protein
MYIMSAIQPKLSLSEPTMNGYFYSVFHFSLLVVSIYLFMNCNKNKSGNRIFEFLLALFCPLIYIIYVIATKSCSN